MGTEAIWIPLVAAALPAIIGGIGSAIGGSEASASNAAVGQAGADKLAGMQAGAKAFGAYRPQMMEAQQKALANQMAQYKPAENMLQSMYGGTSTAGTSGDSGGYTKPADIPGQGGYNQWDPATGKYKTGVPTGMNDYPINPNTGKPYTPAEWAQKAAFDEWVSTQQKNGTYGTGPIQGTPSGNPGGGGGPPIIVNPNPTSLVGPMTQGMAPTPTPNTPAEAAPMIKAMLGGSNVR